MASGGLTNLSGPTVFRPMNRRVAGWLCLGWVLVAGGMAARAAEAPAQFKVSELGFQRPSAWEWVGTAPGGMRKAQLKVPNPSGDAGEVVFFHFGPNNGGGTQANVERWYRQFQGTREQIKAKSEEGKAGEAKVTYVFAEGTYLSGMPGGPQTPKEGYALAGAIIEDPAGAVFVKFTGPKALVDGSREEFKKLVSTAKR